MILTITRVRLSASLTRVGTIATARPPSERLVALRLSQVSGHIRVYK